MTENLCPRCFAPLSPRGVCPECGRRASRPPRPDPRALPEGTLLKNRYVLGGTIGEGGFGVTYFAFDTMRSARVAVKEYFPFTVAARVGKAVEARSPELRGRFSLGKKRFTDEAKNMAAIKNLKDIPTALDYFSENGTAYIVMEYIEGETLKDRVFKKGKMKEGDALALLRPVFSSLALIHDAGLLHRDVSADNIILGKGCAKLIDFGSSVSAGRQQSLELKRRYAPPEQYEKDGSVDRRADVYAAGATLYYCVTGCLPPEATDRLRQDRISFPARLSPHMRAALTKALSLKKEDRYADMREMLADLDGIN